MKIAIKKGNMKKYFDKYGIPVILLLIFLFSFYMRMLPDLGDYLQAIDPYYIYRTTNDLVNNNFELKDIDYMRYYPTGFSPKKELYVIYYLYGLIYVIFFKWLGFSFLKYAQIIPALLGASYVFIMYFIGKELKDKLTGIFASLSIAVLNILYYRSSAGFFEKEPISGLFMLLSFLFFIKMWKSKSIINGVLSGIFTAFAYGVWGGAVALFYLYPLIGLALTFLGKLDWDSSKAYAVTLLTSVIFFNLMYPRYLFLKNTVLMLSFVSAIVILGIEYYNLSKPPENKFRRNASLLLSLFFIFLLSSFFIPFTAKVLSSLSHIIVYRKAVMESTVAENIPANLGYFLSSYGSPERHLSSNLVNLKNYFIQHNNYLVASLLSFLIFILDIVGILVSPYLWIIAGTGLILYLSLKSNSNNIMNVVAIISFAVMILSYGLFLHSSGANTSANILYVLSAALIILFVLYNKPKEGTVLVFATATFLMFVTKVRIGYVTGFWSSLLIAYAFSYIIKDVLKISLESLKNLDWIKISALTFIGIFFIFNTYSLYALAKTVGTGNLNPAWEEAFNFMKNSLPQNATILSWWDFGYWFQTLGERRTLLDGGNQIGVRNIYAARYFTSRYNETEELLYLAVAKPTHILLDYTMIGKYAAMSKIANNGKWIDSYAEMRFRGVKYDQAIYNVYGGYYTVYIPITQNGTLDFNRNIKLAFYRNPQQLMYVRYLCTPEGVIDVFDYTNTTPEKVNFIDECVYILPVDYRLGYMTMKDPRSNYPREIYNSNFHKLYIENGKRIPYVKKVFDNFFVKIYEVNYSYIYERLNELGISKDYINKSFEKCILTPHRQKDINECPLYYKPEERR